MANEGQPAAAGNSLPYGPGTRVGAGGRYQIVRELGRGGMSVVFEARDTTLGDPVALKFLLGGPSQAGASEIREEVRLAHRVASPHVSRVHDLEEIDGNTCIKMEYVEGQTLAERLRTGKTTPPAEVARIGAAIAAGLEAVHAQGIIHRDLKPSNVIVENKTGRLVLMDFGLARAAAGGPRGAAGTPAYMSPEQAAGRSLDARSDLYSLGLLLYELVAGRRPFDVKTVDEMARAHLETPPPPLPAGVPHRLRRIIFKLLEKQPPLRFASAAAVRIALSGPGRRRQAFFALFAALVAAAAVALWPRTPSRLSRAEWRPQVRALSAQEENLDKPAVSPDGRLLAIPSTRAGGNWDIWLCDLADGSWRALTRDPEADETPQFIDDGRAVLFFSTRAGRSGLWRVDVRAGAEPKPLFVIEANRGSFAATLDGRKVLYQRTPRDLALLDLTTQSAVDVVHFPANEGVTDMAMDEAGRRAVLGVRKSSEGGFFVETRSDLYVVALPGGEGRYVTTDGEFNCTASFVPGDPQALIISSRRAGTQSLWKLFLDGRPPFQLTSGAGGDDLFPTMTHDGRRLYYTHDVTVTQLYLLPPGARDWQRLTSELYDHTGPAVDAAGQTLYYTTYDRETGRRRLLASALSAFDPHPVGASQDVLEPAVSADGKELVTTQLVGERRALVLYDAGGALVGLVSQGESAPYCGGATLSADHQAIAYAHDRGEAGLYLLSRSGAKTALSHDVVCYPRFSPIEPGLIGYLKRTSPGAGRLELYDVRTRAVRALATLPFDGTRLAWDPSGDAIYVSDYEKRVIRRLSIDGGRVLEEVPTPGDNLVAFAAGPGGLLVVEGSVGRTRLLSIENIAQSPR